ncbi:hypothetical protein STTU_0396 [Streptomyces sp. Tu6071]|nr:hypothetical protein STTU_0396 [Streptomyces sp. Tu6071]
MARDSPAVRVDGAAGAWGSCGGVRGGAGRGSTGRGAGRGAGARGVPRGAQARARWRRGRRVGGPQDRWARTSAIRVSSIPRGHHGQRRQDGQRGSSHGRSPIPDHRAP